MKKRGLNGVIALLIVGVYALGIFGKPMVTKETFSRSIQAVGEGDYISLFLDEKVYAHARRDLGDLRVIGENGEAVPYYIATTYDSVLTEEMNYSAVIQNEFKKEGWLYSDIKIEGYDEAQDVLINKMVFEIEGQDYAQKIKLFGSYDQMNWSFLKEDVIFSVAAGKNTEVSFQEAVKYPFYRIARKQDKEQIELKEVDAYYNWKQDRVDHYQRDKVWDYERVEEEKVSRLIFHNPNHLPIYEIQLNIIGNFKRDYVLWGITEEGKEIELSAGNLYAMNFEELVSRSTTIPVRDGQDYPRLEVTIQNQDDSPLEIKEAVGSYEAHKLVFKGEKGKKYTLTYGEQTLTKPRYDLEAYKQNIEHIAQLKGELGEEIAILEESKEDKPYDFKGAYTVVIMALSMILIFIIIRSLKKSSL